MLEAAELDFNSAKRQQTLLQQELGQVRGGRACKGPGKFARGVLWFRGKPLGGLHLLIGSTAAACLPLAALPTITPAQPECINGSATLHCHKCAPANWLLTSLCVVLIDCYPASFALRMASVRSQARQQQWQQQAAWQATCRSSCCLRPPLACRGCCPWVLQWRAVCCLASRTDTLCGKMLTTCRWGWLLPLAVGFMLCAAAVLVVYLAEQGLCWSRKLKIASNKLTQALLASCHTAPQASRHRHLSRKHRLMGQ